MSILIARFKGFQLASTCRLLSSAIDAANKTKASPEQLALMEKKLVEHLPDFFKGHHMFSLYTKDVMLVDNIRNLKTQGLSSYATQVALIKIYYHMRYSSKKLELLNLVKNPEESYIRVRWRIVTTPGQLGTLLYVGAFKLKAGEKWKDGISTFHVNQNGLIYCHVCDNIDVDTNETTSTNKQKHHLYY